MKRGLHTFVPLFVLLWPTIAFAQQAETIEYYQADLVGSIRIVYDAFGNVIGRQDYTPFGTPVLNGTSMRKEGFGGNEKDDETQQMYFHARSLSTRTGRFISTDPLFQGLMDPQRWNRYAYAVDAPLTYADLNGMSAPPVYGPGNPYNCDNPILYAELHCGAVGVQTQLDFLGFSAGGPAFQDQRNRGGGVIKPAPVQPSTTEGPTDQPTSTKDKLVDTINQITPPTFINRSDHTVCLKPEHGDNAPMIPVPSGEARTVAFDGFADPARPNQVYKVRSMGSARYFGGGWVDSWPSPLLMGPLDFAWRAAQVIGGGWEGASFLAAHPDWTNTFQASLTGCSGR